MNIKNEALARQLWEIGIRAKVKAHKRASISTPRWEDLSEDSLKGWEAIAAHVEHLKNK